MKKSFLAAASAAITLVSASIGQADNITLRLSNWFPPAFYANEKIVEPWAADVERVTEGRVRIDILPKVVGSVPGQFDVARDGLADVTIVVPGYTPERFPLIAFAELPLLPLDSRKLAPALNTVFQESAELKSEFDGVHVLGIYPAAPLHIITRGKTISSVEDLEGLKFRSSGKTLTHTLQSIGVTPILKSAAEAHEMLSSGAIDGQVTLPSIITGFNTLDLADNILVLPGGLGSASTAFVVNPDKWAKISAEDQAAITEVSDELFNNRVSQINDDVQREAIEEMRNAGYSVTYASEELIGELTEITAPVRDQWIMRAKKAGLENPEAVLETYIRAGASN